MTVTGLAGSSESLLLRGLAEDLKRPILVVTQLPDEANDLYDDLRFLMGQHRVGHYPSRQILPYDFRAPVGEILGKRISSLAGMLSGEMEIVICPVRALLEPTISVDQLEESRIELVQGEETDLDELVRRLRTAPTPVVARIEDDAVVLDVRTIGVEEQQVVSEMLGKVLG